jgi:hypothetical protein
LPSSPERPPVCRRAPSPHRPARTRHRQPRSVEERAAAWPSARFSVELSHRDGKDGREGGASRRRWLSHGGGFFGMEKRRNEVRVLTGLEGSSVRGDLGPSVFIQWTRLLRVR